MCSIMSSRTSGCLCLVPIREPSSRARPAQNGSSERSGAVAWLDAGAAAVREGVRVRRLIEANVDRQSLEPELFCRPPDHRCGDTFRLVVGRRVIESRHLNRDDLVGERLLYLSGDVPKARLQLSEI